MGKWVTVQVGSAVRVRRAEAKSKAKSAAKAEKVSADDHTKDELVALAEKRGVDASGTKAEIAERLNA
jgi:hypothetical protein